MTLKTKQMEFQCNPLSMYYNAHIKLVECLQMFDIVVSASRHTKFIRLIDT